MTMGVVFDRVLESFDGPFEKLAGPASPPVVPALPPASAGYLIDRRANDALIAANRLLKNGSEVYVLSAPADIAGTRHEAGTLFVAGGAASLAVLERAARELGVPVTAAAVRPPSLRRLSAARIGLWDRYGGSMPSGWIRWLLEQFEFPFEVVYPAALDAGDLHARFDVLIFPDGAIPERDSASPGPFPEGQPAAGAIPAEFRDRLGRVTVSATVPNLRAFLESGGTIFTFGRSTALARHLGLPVEDALAERQPDGSLKPLPREKFYIPGSVLRARVDTSQPLAWGVADQLDLFFDESPVFRLGPRGHGEGDRPGGVVRDVPAPAQRLGLGPALPRRLGGDCRRARREGSPRDVGAGGHHARTDPRHLQAPVQRPVHDRRRRPVRSVSPGKTGRPRRHPGPGGNRGRELFRGHEGGNDSRPLFS